MSVAVIVLDVNGGWLGLHSTGPGLSLCSGPGISYPLWRCNIQAPYFDCGLTFPFGAQGAEKAHIV